MKTNWDVSIDLDITMTIIVGILVIITGILSLFTLKDVNFATTCMVTGSGLCGLAKVANTMYDNSHD